MISTDVRRQLGRLPNRDDVDVPEVAELVAELRRLAAEHDEAQRAEDEARQAHEAAEKADREALADAMRAGEADPGSRNVDKAAKRLGDARRRREALARAAEKSYSELAETVKEHRDGWLAALVERQAAESGKSPPRSASSKRPTALSPRASASNGGSLASLRRSSRRRA